MWIGHALSGLNIDGCKSSESRVTDKSTIDGPNGSLTLAESLACRQQLIGPPQAIASDILLGLVQPTIQPKLQGNIELGSEIMP